MTHIYSHCHLSCGNDVMLGMNFSWSQGHIYINKKKKGPLYIYTVNGNNKQWLFLLFITSPWRTTGAKFGVLSKEPVFNSLAFCAESSNSPLCGAGRVIVGTLTRGKHCSIKVAFCLLCQGKQSAGNIYIYIYIYK